jgi:hypothetical protein
MITSTELSGSGMCSISPFKNSTFVTAALTLFAFASASISSVMSNPYALPVGPTRRADNSTSIPPPEPRSSTVSPAFSLASAVGLPQPRDAFMASSGIWPASDASYKFEVIGSHDVPAGDAPQQELPPDRARVAASAYFSRTVSRMLGSLIHPPICRAGRFLWDSTLCCACSIRHTGRSEAPAALRCLRCNEGRCSRAAH